MLNVNGTTPTAVLDLGTNNTVTAATLVIAPGGTLTKSGNGKLVISTLSSLQTGSTLNVTAGTAALNGTSSVGSAGTAAASGTGTIVIGGTFSGLATASGGGVLTGTGTAGSLSLTAGGHLAPGTSAAAGVIGTISIGGGVTIGSGAVLDFDFAALGSNDTGLVGGALTLSGAETLNINALTGFSLGDYTLFTAIGAISNFASFTFNTTGAGAIPAAYSVVTSGNLLRLHVVAPLVNLTWAGTTDNKWDTTSNWSPTNPYCDANTVAFNDGAANTNPINIVSPVSPVSVTFNNTTATTYSVGGAAIGGTTGLTKNNNGTVILTGANTYTGTTAINGGTLSISTDSNIGTAPGTAAPGALVINGGTLAVTGAMVLDANRGLAVGTGTNTINVATGVTLSYGGIIANFTGSPGGLVKTGSGILDLSGSSTFSGGLTVSDGRVIIDNVSSFASAMTNNSAAADALTINQGGNNLNYTAVIGGTGGLTKTGTGNLTLSGAAANTYGGPTTVTGGTLTLAKTGGAVSIPGNVTTTGGSSIFYSTANQIADTADVVIGDLATGGNIRVGGNGSPVSDTFHNLTITVPVGSTYGVGNPFTSVLSSLTLTGTLSVTNGEHDFVNSNTTLTANALIMNGTVGRIGANAANSTINVGAGGLSMTNAQFTVGTAGGAPAAVINLSGDFTGNGTNTFLVSNNNGVRALDLQAGTRTFNVATGTTTVQTMVQNGSLTVTGGGTLVLTAANTYVNTLITGGTLQIGNGGITGTLGSGTITDNGTLVFNHSDTVNLLTAINGSGTVTNAGGAASILNLNGAQNYATLNANGGVTNVIGSFTSGTATVNANATTNFYSSQTLAALNIADGVEVTFGDGLPFAGEPGKFGAPALVPEPGALGLLVVGALGFLARRRRGAQFAR